MVCPYKALQLYGALQHGLWPLQKSLSKLTCLLSQPAGHYTWLFRKWIFQHFGIAELHHSFISHLNDSVQCRYQRTKLLSCILVLVLTVPANGSWRPMPSPNQSRHSREMLSISTRNWLLITVVQAIGKNFTQANGKGTAIYRFSAFEAGRAFLPFLYRTFRYPLFPKELFTSNMRTL